MPKELCRRPISEKTPISVLLPTMKEAGICSFALLDFLLRKQNDFLDRYMKATERLVWLPPLDLPILGCVAQLVTCLATDVSLTADPEDASLIPAQSHTFVEIDHELISMVILLPSTESFKKGFCQ